MAAPMLSLPAIDIRPDPSAVGSKFEPDGRLKRFPGNTILCPVPEGHPAMAPLCAMQAALAASAAGRHLSLLPPSSFHMTVFEGVCDHLRQDGRWPNDAGDRDLAALTRDFAVLLRREAAPLPIRMRPLQVGGRQGLGLVLEGADAAVERRLRGFRDRASHLLGLRRPEHDSYLFHITLAYFITAPDEAELAALRHAAASATAAFRAALPVFSLPAPSLTTFEDMGAFLPVLTLREDPALA
jgi:hypothetical protein